ncbi:unnamed protein product [Mytilus edulis]|uniref:Peptidase S1 domain-containing protein n=1 Tax=Mytilus edulis TaxID=6550 RepID=A0A8S3QZE3_MYTED|nr:unnamed protein product [Mytilus edulis]
MINAKLERERMRQEAAITKMTFAADTSVKIVNGEDANIEDHPWMVSLQVRDYEGGNFTHICGGAIIDRSWVLTAAHCVNYRAYEPKNMRVVAGSSFLSQMKQIIPLKKYYVHEKYNTLEGGIEPDLMLLQLKTPLKFGSTVNKIDLDKDTGKNYTGELCTISGWGTTNATKSGSNYPDRLQVLSMPVVSKEYCLASWSFTPTFLKNIICLQDGKKDSCNRDSGGPLVCSKKLVGVLSFGAITICDGRVPSVHIRVSAYTDWIEEKLKNKNKKNNKDKKAKNNKNDNKGKKNNKDKKNNKEKKNNKN